MKKLLSFILCISLIFASAAVCFAAEPAGDENYKTKADGHKYYIMVNRQMNTVTVYTAGDDGYYSKPYKAMVCSTAREGHTTPSGTFSSSQLARWCYMVDGSYGQYATRI
ncbi:MAG: L,D-transpeptidase, partial [Firmicutes bacterium]|nr:L,D-transpeptidase [Bacillota bacterium]